MEVTFAFLCDYADTTGPKLTAVGVGIDTIRAREVPAQHYLLYAVAAFRFTIAETRSGTRKLAVHLVDADGEAVMPPLNVDIPMEPPQAGYGYRTHRVALALQGLTFRRYGDYSVSWLVDGVEVKTLPLKVVPSDQSGPPVPQ